MFAKLLYLMLVSFHCNSLITVNDTEIFVCINDTPLLNVRIYLPGNFCPHERKFPGTKVPGPWGRKFLRTNVPVFIRGCHSVVCWPSHTRESSNSDGQYSHSSNLNNANKNCGSHQQRRYWISGRPSKAHHSRPVRSLQLVEVWQYLKERKKERKSVMSTARKPYCTNGYLWWVHIKHASAHWRTKRHLVVSCATSYGSRRRRRYGWISWNCWHWV